MFQCDMCGECCRNLGRSSLYRALHDGDGVCRYLTGNMCSIYKDRPLLCRVEECYDAFFKDILSYEEYMKLNYKYCKELKRRS